MELTTVWFGLIAVLWIGYFTLEGFDFGVGMLLPFLARNETERRVTEIIDSLRGSLTIIVVAHRLSTVRDCDQVVFLDQGTVEAANPETSVRVKAM